MRGSTGTAVGRGGIKRIPIGISFSVFFGCVDFLAPAASALSSSLAPLLLPLPLALAPRPVLDGFAPLPPSLPRTGDAPTPTLTRTLPRPVPTPGYVCFLSTRCVPETTCTAPPRLPGEEQRDQVLKRCARRRW